MRAEQRLIQSPQMIQAMQVLQLPLIELKDQVEQELQENIFLERQDDADRGADASGEGDSTQTDATQSTDAYEDRLQREFTAEIDQLESRSDQDWRQRGSSYSNDDEDKKFEALQNTPGRSTSLADYLMTQVRTQESDQALIEVIEHIVFSLSEDGRLTDTAEAIAMQLSAPLPSSRTLFSSALLPAFASRLTCKNALEPFSSETESSASCSHETRF